LHHVIDALSGVKEPSGKSMTRRRRVENPLGIETGTVRCGPTS
jgi:hypothetical protein